LRYNIDPKSGNKLSALGLGGMRFPRGISGTDISKTEQIVLSAVENGVNYFDTAFIYPGSETVLGEILHKNNLRESVYIATKLPLGKCGTYADFDRLFNIQLERLQTDYIDYYLMHNMPTVAEWNRLKALGIEDWLAEKRSSGAVRQIGFSFHGIQSEFLALLEEYPWDFTYIQYNYADENYQAGRKGLEKAAAMGMSVIIMEPLLGGKLASGLPKGAIRAFSESSSATPAAWAFRWLFDQPQVTMVLSGMASAELLRQNAEVAENTAVNSITEQEREVYAKAIAAFKEAYKIPCTGCNYCMPCPAGANIPGVFAAYNMRYAAGYITGMTQYVTGTGGMSDGKGSSGKNCVQCGKCEKHCPQGIAIADELRKVTRKMEPFWFPAAAGIVRGVMNGQRKKDEKK